MPNINVEMLKERLYKASKALFIISETLVDVSKQHISAERAIDKIRSYMYDTDVVGSRYRVDRLIEDCMEPIISNTFDEEILDILGANMMFPAEFYDENCPQVCVGCSNNPKNGGSGICNCTLPYMQNLTNYTVPFGDACMANNTGGYVYTVSTKLPDASTPTANIEDAIERI
jgi:hypothetical protein